MKLSAAKVKNLRQPGRYSDGAGLYTLFVRRVPGHGCSASLLTVEGVTLG